jgi:prepilin-type N-terminal cleavage/methylation domain-containing protein
MITESIKIGLSRIFRRKATGMPGLDDRGFTLLEVVISIAILLVAAFALTTLNAGTWKNTDSSKSYTEASVLAARNLEALFSEKYSSDQVSGMSPAITAGDTPFTSSDGRYSGTYRIRDNDILPDTKTVQMTVSFVRGSSTKTVHFNYLLPVRK